MNAQSYALGTRMWSLECGPEPTLEAMRFEVMRANIESEVILIRNRDFMIFGMIVTMLMTGGLLTYVLVRSNTISNTLLVSSNAIGILLALLGVAAIVSSLAAAVRLHLNQRHQQDLLRSLELQLRLRHSMESLISPAESGAALGESKQTRKSK